MATGHSHLLSKPPALAEKVVSKLVKALPGARKVWFTRLLFLAAKVLPDCSGVPAIRPLPVASRAGQTDAKGNAKRPRIG